MVINKAIIRACLQPFSSFSKTLSLEADFKEAIYLASPDLYEKSKLESYQSCNSLNRYWLRGSTRPTPFGLFAGCGIADATLDSQLIEAKKYYARLDFRLIQEIVTCLLEDPLIKTKSRYFINNSIYQVHGEYRYVEYQRGLSKRTYTLRGVKASEVLNAVIKIAHKGSDWHNILSKIMATASCETKEAESFLNELIESQILVSELEPGVAHEDQLTKLIYTFETWTQPKDSITNTPSGITAEPDRQKLQAYLQWLVELQIYLNEEKLQSPEFSKVGKQMKRHLRSKFPDLSAQYLFHVDTLISYKTAQPLLTGRSSVAQLVPDDLIKEVFAALNKLSEPAIQPNMDVFKKHFAQRYDGREVPLLEALDPDIGIGYFPNANSNHHPFLKDLIFPKAENEFTAQVFDKTALLKKRLLQNATYQGKKTVELTENLISSLVGNEDDLPPSMSVMYRKVAGNQLLLESFGGVSAVNMMSRFAYANPDIKDLVEEICKAEAKNNPDVIFARIVHLPEEQAGNVLQHQTLRQYEIAYISPSSVSDEYQLPLSDLYLSLQQGELVMRSSKLNKRVIPRLDTAHNHALSELPLYRFLCDLQYQGLRTHFGFDWGHIEQYYKFLPRVSYKNKILQPAIWKFDHADMKALGNAENNDERIDAFRKFCKQWQLPKCWVYAEEDRELLINADDPEHVMLWWELIRKKEAITIKEYFPPDTTSIVNDNAEPHAHQVLVPWINQKPTYRKVKREINSELQRSFPPGSAWLYFKIYCKAGISDILLKELVRPMVNDLKNLKMVDHWFFIRYADPEEHLRIRFHLSKPAHTGHILHEMHIAFEKYLQTGIVIKYQLDTYQREIERYHGLSVQDSEVIFSSDSDAILDLLTQGWGDEAENKRWQWGIVSVDKLMEDFKFTLQDKCDLMAELKSAFVREFGIDKSSRVALDKKYRSQKRFIQSLLSDKEIEKGRNDWIVVYKKRSLRNATTIAALLNRHAQSEIHDLLKSYIHMSVNRIFASAQRQQEFVLYYFLSKYYHSLTKIRQHKQMIENTSGYSLI